VYVFLIEGYQYNKVIYKAYPKDPIFNIQLNYGDLMVMVMD